MDISTPDLSSLLAQNNELLLRIYALLLFALGVAAACFVVFLLYNFLRKFF